MKRSRVPSQCNRGGRAIKRRYGWYFRILARYKYIYRRVSAFLPSFSSCRIISTALIPKHRDMNLYLSFSIFLSAPRSITPPSSFLFCRVLLYTTRQSDNFTFTEMPLTMLESFPLYAHLKSSSRLRTGRGSFYKLKNKR